MNDSTRLSRRSMLRLSALAASSTLLAACQPSAPPVATQPPAAAAAGQPTQTPVVVEKLVTQVVEVVVTPTAEPLAKVGPDLLYPQPEGGTVVTDVSKFPSTFAESPLVTALVKSNKLPPVEQRLPVREDLLVVQPLNEPGKYGGTIRRGFVGPGDMQNMGRFGGLDMFLFWDARVENLIPNLAKAWELSSDYTSTTLHLRQGLRWSDGEPVTADDIMFWFDDVWNNTSLVPKKSVHLAASTPQGPVEGKIVKIDNYTVRYEFAAPYASLPEQLANLNPITGPSKNWQLDGVSGGIMPAHYMKQFHASYTDPAKLDQMAKDAKLDDWVALFKLKHNWNLNPDLPALTPWKVTSPINTSTWVYERNPYFWGVDTAGNQLPYIDRIVLTLSESPEVVNLRAIAGDFDYQDRHLTLDKMPVFLQNQQKGDYKVYLDPTSYGSNIGIVWNHSYDADPEIAKWLLNIDFRKAISMGVDKQQFNETFYAGLGVINSGVPAPTNPYYPGPEWDKPAWIAYDLAKANALLDSIRLDKKDSDGYRLRSDGQGRLNFALSCSPTAALPTCKAGEMLTQHFKQMGLYLEPMSIQDAQLNDMIAMNKHQFVLWENNSSEVMFEQAGQYIPVNFPNWIGPEISKWFDTNGEQGKPPPDGFDMDRVVQLWRQGRTLPRDQRKPLGQEIWKIYVEKLYHVPFVGQAPAALGIHIAKTGMGNIPRRVAVSSSGQTPGDARTETFYWKSA